MCKLKGGSIETHMRRIGQATQAPQSDLQPTDLKVTNWKEIIATRNKTIDNEFVVKLSCYEYFGINA